MLSFLIFVTLPSVYLCDIKLAQTFVMRQYAFILNIQDHRHRCFNARNLLEGIYDCMNVRLAFPVPSALMEDINK